MTTQNAFVAELRKQQENYRGELGRALRPASSNTSVRARAVDSNRPCASPAPFRDTPPPNWVFVAALCRRIERESAGQKP